MALPAGIWILTIAATFFFAMTVVLFLVCRVRRGQSLATWLKSISTSVSRPKMLTSTLSFMWSALISAICAGEVGERAFLDADALADLVLELGLARAALLGAVALGGEERLDLAARQRRRLLALAALADEPGDAGRVADAVPGLVVHLAAHEQVAGEDLALDGLLLAVLELDDVLHRDDDLEDLVLHVHATGCGRARLAVTFFS